MHIYLTEHCRKQLKKRECDKDEKWIKNKFKEILNAYHKKQYYECHKSFIYNAKDTYGTDNYKLICGKYGFIYNKQGTEYTIITYITKDNRIKVNGHFYNLNN